MCHDRSLSVIGRKYHLPHVVGAPCLTSSKHEVSRDNMLSLETGLIYDMLALGEDTDQSDVLQVLNYSQMCFMSRIKEQAIHLPCITQNYMSVSFTMAFKMKQPKNSELYANERDAFKDCTLSSWKSLS